MLRKPATTTPKQFQTTWCFGKDWQHALLLQAGLETFNQQPCSRDPVAGPGVGIAFGEASLSGVGRYLVLGEAFDVSRQRLGGLLVIWMR